MDFDLFCKTVENRLLSLTEAQKRQFASLDSLYRDWNSKINVISRKDIDELYSHHVLHSLSIAAYALSQGIDLSSAKILDLGTGGGFPGVPLAIFYPKAHFVLCDSIGKKVKVAQEVSKALGLKNVDCVNARAESLEEQFDWVVSRAVTQLDNFIPWVKGKYSDGILYLKGGDIVEEIATAMSHNHLPKGSVHTWKIDNWLDDEYFDEKYVIHLDSKPQK